MLGFLLDIELYVCPRSLFVLVLVVLVVCECAGVLYAIFSAAAAVCGGFVGFVGCAIDVSGSSSTFFAHTYTIHGRHTFVCACVLVGM